MRALSENDMAAMESLCAESVSAELLGEVELTDSTRPGPSSSMREW